MDLTFIKAIDTGTVLAHSPTRYTENELADVPNRNYTILIDGNQWSITEVKESTELPSEGQYVYEAKIKPQPHKQSLQTTS